MPRVAILIAAIALAGLSDSTQAQTCPEDVVWPVKVAVVEDQALNASKQASYADDEEAGDDDEDIEDQQEATASTESHKSKRLDALKKPLSTVRITATSGGENVPLSRAPDVLGNQPAVHISSTDAASPTFDRYTLRFCHRPLYFEERNLERCGKTYGCATNAVSGVYFLTNTALIPYRIATQRPDCTVATPGDCKTCQQFDCDIEPLGHEPRGALLEAAAAAGFVFLLL
jgi:hypothetical protein